MNQCHSNTNVVDVNANDTENLVSGSEPATDENLYVINDINSKNTFYIVAKSEQEAAARVNEIIKTKILTNWDIKIGNVS